MFPLTWKKLRGGLLLSSKWRRVSRYPLPLAAKREATALPEAVASLLVLASSRGISIDSLQLAAESATVLDIA